MTTKRVPSEEIVSAYRQTGSVWKAAKLLGLCGQSVWERLRALGHEMPSRVWTTEEKAELRALASHCTIGDIARRLGRPYAAVACKISRLGLAQRFGNRGPKKIPRGSGYTKQAVGGWVRELRVYDGSIRQFSRAKGLDLEMLVAAIQKHDMPFWGEYARSHSDIPESVCPYCQRKFHPMSKKQVTCSRKCSNDMRQDNRYFSGKRRNAIGMADGVCQLCLQTKKRGLSAHHMFGKENDPGDECLIALCRGCHRLVGDLAGRRFVDTPEGWESLIGLVMSRRCGSTALEHGGVYACVDFEFLTTAEMEEEEESSGEQPCAVVTVELA